jgi:hypothetical protein
MIKKAKAKKDGPTLTALTLKVDEKLFIRMSAHRAKERITFQDMMTEALRAYLTRPGA